MAASSTGRDGMIPASVHLGRVSGIPIGLHYSWFIIAGLITLSLWTQFRSIHPDWSMALTWSVALGTALLFFVTLLLHELSHAAVASARGLPVRSITLFALGGLATIGKESNSAKTEFLVAIVGPVTSFAIGFACLGVAQSLGWSYDSRGGGVIGSVLGWLGSINVLLATFNLIPGYPLDGGRVLRALLWGVSGDGDRATRNAARVGQVVAGLFIALGLWQFLIGNLGGLWIAFIGWFLLTAAQASHADVTIREALRGVRVADVMTNDCATVDPATRLQTLVDDVLLRTGRRCAVVSSGSQVVGLVTTHEVRTIDREQWTSTTVADVMRPLDQLRTVPPDMPVADALGAMTRDDVNQLPVVTGGRLAGIVTRGQILQLLQARSELKAA